LAALTMCGRRVVSLLMRWGQASGSAVTKRKQLKILNGLFLRAVRRSGHAGRVR
jgi:hypothetical protein